MAVTYGFFNSVNGDRKYNAEQMSEYFRGIVNEGVFQHLDGGLAVTAGTGLAVSVASGRAIIQNRWVQNSDAMTLSISAASETYARKDAVVVRLNYSTRSIEIAVKAGTPAASPSAPSMTRNSTTYEMALAYVNVAANATSVTVTDKRSDSTVCGWVTVAQSTSGEVDAMLNAMKTGFDGVSYDSPAAMVTGEDEKLNGEITDLKSEINEYEGSKPFTISSNLLDPSKVSAKGEYWVAGVKYVDTGTTGNTSKMVSVKMPCEAEAIYCNALYNISNNQRVNNSNVTYLNYFKADGTYISWENCPFVQVNGVYQGRFTTPSECGYVMITYVAYENGTDSVPYRKALCQNAPVPNTYTDYVLYDLHSAKSAIDNLGAETKFKEVITGTSSYQENGGTILNGGTWGSGPDSTSYTHIVVPCDADFTFFSIKAVQGQYFYMVAVKEYVRHSSAGETIQDTTDYWFKPVYVDSNKAISGMVPKDAKYLLVTSKSGGVSIISSLTITKYYNADKTPYNINRCTLGAFNVRDFGDGTTSGGCPSALVSEKLPLWKNLVSEWLNTDFLNVTEWRTKFDEGNTIDSYGTLFEQFFPYKYEVIYDNVAIQCIMSKHECIFTDLSYYGDVNRLVPMLITVISGKSVAIVGWIQSATDTVANREKAYRNAATMLGTFDRVILGGDFNTEVGLEELEELTDKGYTLGNGGYWGTINTWPANNPATPNDNIASKDCIFELFETNENHITSDHLPVRAKFTL